MVLIYGECHKNAYAAVRLYEVRFPERPRPDRKTFVSLCANLDNYGSFKKQKHLEERELQQMKIQR